MKQRIYLLAILLFGVCRIDANCKESSHKNYVCSKYSIEIMNNIPSDALGIVLTGNKVGKITRTMTSRFASTLESLVLIGCDIVEIEDDAFDGFKSLSTFFLQDNRLANLKGTWFKEMASLNTLVLSKNNITHCDNIQSLTSLEQINFINIRRNPDLEESCMYEIKRVSNRCKWLSYAKYMCKHVTLREIRKVPNNIKKLEISDVPVNNITAAGFSRFASTLEHLECSQCNISVIDKNAFSGFDRLQTLHLQGNKLMKLNAANLEKPNLNINGIRGCENIYMSADLEKVDYMNIINDPDLDNRSYMYEITRID